MIVLIHSQASNIQMQKTGAKALSQGNQTVPASDLERSKDHRGAGRSGPPHRGPTGDAGPARTSSGSELCMSSNQPWKPSRKQTNDKPMTPELECVYSLNDNHGKSMIPNRTQVPTPTTNLWKRSLQSLSTLFCQEFRKSFRPLPKLRPIDKRSLLPLIAVAFSSLLEPKHVNAIGIIDPGVISFEKSPISSTVPFEGTVGWSFIVNEPRKVSLLGVYDAGADGLADATEVGLWERDMLSNNGYLLASATVPAGTAGTLFGQFRYTSILQLTLQPGIEYTLGALYTQPYTSDRYQGYASIDYGANSDPKFASWIQQYSSNFYPSYLCVGSPCSKSLVYPYYVGNFSADGYYGPNIAGVVGKVPEVPGPMPILGMVAAFNFSRKLRRRNRTLI